MQGLKPEARWIQGRGICEWFPIPSMGLVYLPTWNPYKSTIHVGKYTIHGWYGFTRYVLKVRDFPDPILWQGWDVSTINHQSYSREGSGILGIHQVMTQPWPFDPLVGGSLNLWKVHLTIPKRAPAELPGTQIHQPSTTGRRYQSERKNTKHHFFFAFFLAPLWKTHVWNRKILHKYSGTFRLTMWIQRKNRFALRDPKSLMSVFPLGCRTQFTKVRAPRKSNSKVDKPKVLLTNKGEHNKLQFQISYVPSILVYLSFGLRIFGHMLKRNQQQKMFERFHPPKGTPEPLGESWEPSKGYVGKIIE